MSDFVCRMPERREDNSVARPWAASSKSSYVGSRKKPPLTWFRDPVGNYYHAGNSKQGSGTSGESIGFRLSAPQSATAFPMRNPARFRFVSFPAVSLTGSENTVSTERSVRETIARRDWHRRAKCTSISRLRGNKISTRNDTRSCCIVHCVRRIARKRCNDGDALRALGFTVQSSV